MVFLNHGVMGVVDDIQEDLLQLIIVGHDPRQVFGQFLDYLHVVQPQLIVAKTEGTFYDLVDVHLCSLRPLLTGEGEQVLHYPLRPHSIVVNPLQILLDTLVHIADLQELGVSHDRSQRIIQLVGHAGDHLANGRKLGRLDQMRLETNPF